MNLKMALHHRHKAPRSSAMPTGTWAWTLIIPLLVAGCRSPSGSSDPSTLDTRHSAATTAAAKTQWLPPSLRTNEPSLNTNLASLNTNLSSLTTNASPIFETQDILRPGESIKIIFSDLPREAGLQELPVRIGDDGKITLYYNITVQAAGKTPNQLQRDIRDKYVPKYFTRLTVTVKTDDRFYYVGGEVRLASRQVYVGHMTVLRAIDTSGGFGEFADRTNIELRRANGQLIKVNGKKAIKNPKLDPEVFPGDQVFVHRRWM